MLDERALRKDPDAVAAALSRRGFRMDRAAYRALERRRRHCERALQALQAERNAASRRIGEMVTAQGMSVSQAKAELAAALERVERDERGLSESARVSRAALDDWLMGLPNLLDDSVPDGADEGANQVVSQCGEPRGFDFGAKDHVALGEALGILDLDAAAAISGARFSVWRGAGAKLQRALAHCMLEMHIAEHGYREVQVPHLVHADALVGTGQLPKFERELFRVDGDPPRWLIPTAEVPVSNLARDAIVEDPDSLPLRYVCHSQCFRAEAGSHGRDTRGIVRQHEFGKVELVQITRPEQGRPALEELTEHAEAVLRRLELPYRRVLLCAGDIGFSARLTYDLEVWMPGLGAWREVSSCSWCGDFQARRMRARWRDPATGKPRLAHTLNGSALALGRTAAALLENGQRANGAVALPDALRGYMGADAIEPPGRGERGGLTRAHSAL